MVELSEERKLFWIRQSLEKVSDKSKPTVSGSFWKGVFCGLLLSIPAWLITFGLIL